MIKFGTSGWRAIIGDEFTKVNIQKLALALANKMNNEGVTENGVIIGYDRRFLSEEAMKWAGEVFAHENIPSYLVNQAAPTPLIMFYVMKHELSYGMMVTASHNPAIYNGVKVFTYGGRDADETQTKDIEEYIADIDDEDVIGMCYDKAVLLGKIIEMNPLNEYLVNMIDSIDIKKIREYGLRVALNPVCGVNETSLKTILHTSRCDIRSIHDCHDTFFGGELPLPTVERLRNLHNYVIEYQCDIGIVTDGDADRIGVIDDTGRVLHPNDILVILYYYLVKYKGWNGPVVRNTATTHVLDKVAECFGQKCYEVPVGFKHISAKMHETNAVIGGESSGGLTVRGYIKGKDGIYAAMLLIEMIAVTKKKISEIATDIEAEFGTIFIEERDYKFNQEKKEQIFKILIQDKYLPDIPYEIEKISYLDGCKVYFKNNGWMIARFSGTEPLLRIFCEMPSKEDAKKVCKLFENFLSLAR